MSRRKAKIVCTLGPTSSSPRIIERLVAAGMDVARLNFSHGSHAQHASRIAAVRQAATKHERPVGILADLQGPKIRTGLLDGGRAVHLRAGQAFTITTRNVIGNAEGVSTTFLALPESVRKGDRVLLSDGEIALRVLASRGRDVLCKVENGGDLGEQQGINLPGVKLKIPALTRKDREDLKFALEAGADFIALSFVRTAGDVRAAQKAIRLGGKNASVIAKLEKPEAIDHLDEILSTADGVMVARGDLGAEMSPEQVPVVQKQVILRARNALVPVITATQMLDSMQKNPRPTRAEASDVANAIFDGSDALMLSGETAAGAYPIESVEMMDRIIREAEANISDPPRPTRFTELHIAEAIAEATCHAAEELRLRVVAVFTETGFSARLVSKYRPPVPIVAFSPKTETRRRLTLLWGVLPRTIADVHAVDELAKVAEARLKDERLVKRGDIVAIVAGTPIGERGTTNLLRLIRIGGGLIPRTFLGRQRTGE
ncbi:MAG TPA: pyruvate kinase [Candidatus Acidoferrales bacterium]|nr:pyruvate kinase [Candidatus Acidoferrales bacterium]